MKKDFVGALYTNCIHLKAALPVTRQVHESTKSKIAHHFIYVIQSSFL